MSFFKTIFYSEASELNWTEGKTNFNLLPKMSYISGEAPRYSRLFTSVIHVRKYSRKYY